MRNLVIFQIDQFDKPQILYQIQQSQQSRRRRPYIIPLGLNGGNVRAMHESHKDHFQSFRVDIVAFDLDMHEVGVVLRNQLSKDLGSISAKDEIVKDESFCACLVDY